MKKKVLLIVSVLLSLGIFSACSSDDEEGIVVNATSDSHKYENNTEPPQINDIQELITNISTFNIPRKQMDVRDMPDWLSDHINKAIERKKSVPISFWYYQFNWKDSTYYLIISSYTAWLFENVYDSKGEKIDLSQSQEEVDDLLAYSSEWFIIYGV